MKQRATMTVLSTNDAVNEIKQLKVVYLEYYKTVYETACIHTPRAAVVIYTSKYAFKSLKTEDIQLATCTACFLMFMELFPTPGWVTITDVGWKQSAPVGHMCLRAALGAHSMFALPGELIRSWEPGRAPTQHWLSFAEVVSLSLVCARLSTALWHLPRRRIIRKARLTSAFRLKMKVVNF